MTRRRAELSDTAIAGLADFWKARETWLRAPRLDPGTERLYTDYCLAATNAATLVAVELGIPFIAAAEPSRVEPSGNDTPADVRSAGGHHDENYQTPQR